ncbi:MAG: hypothetical protein HQK67_09820 [Desulfamplus sp.]|nr:hypothetical protein [Desulfamplus sp.]
MKNIEDTNTKRETTEIEAAETKDVVADGMSIRDKAIVELLIKTDRCKSIMGFIKKENMRLEDQVTMQDIYNAIPWVHKKTFGEIDRKTIDDILLEYKNTPIVRDLLEQKPSHSYGGITIIRLLDLIRDALTEDEDGFTEEYNGIIYDIKNKMFELFADWKGYDWEPRNNWTIPVNEELRIYPCDHDEIINVNKDINKANFESVVIDIDNDLIALYKYDTIKGEKHEIEIFRSREKTDSFIKALIDARDKIFPEKIASEAIWEWLNSKGLFR